MRFEKANLVKPIRDCCDTAAILFAATYSEATITYTIRYRIKIKTKPFFA